MVGFSKGVWLAPNPPPWIHPCVRHSLPLIRIVFFCLLSKRKMAALCGGMKLTKDEKMDSVRRWIYTFYSCTYDNLNNSYHTTYIRDSWGNQEYIHNPHWRNWSSTDCCHSKRTFLRCWCQARHFRHRVRIVQIYFTPDCGQIGRASCRERV